MPSQQPEPEIVTESKKKKGRSNKGIFDVIHIALILGGYLLMTKVLIFARKSSV